MPRDTVTRPPAGSAGQPPAKKRRRSKNKQLSPIDELRNAVRWATRTNNAALALWVYDEALRRKIQVPDDACVGILYLCAGGMRTRCTT